MKISPQVAMTLRQIMLMNFGFFGIQYSFGLQQTAINPIFSFLHADPSQLPILNMAGPITGLLVQPMIGAMSDRMGAWIGSPPPVFLDWRHRLQPLSLYLSARYRLVGGRIAAVALGHQQQHGNGTFPCLYCRYRS